MLLLPMAFLASCSDDDQIPSANLEITFKNAAMVNNNLVTVQATDVADFFGVDGITVKSTNGNATVLSTVDYYIDHNYVGSNAISPFSATFDTSTLPVGNHLLEMRFAILQIDKSIFPCTYSTVFTVLDPADLPADAPLGTVVSPITVKPE